MNLKNAILIFMISILAPAVNAETVEISSAGIAKAGIVIPENASAPEKNAADELKSYLNKITGGKFTISPENEHKKLPAAIYVGNTRRFKERFPETGLDKIPDDTIIIKVCGNELFLCGGGTRGTLYAVYSFLDDFCGVRWYTPEFEKVPLKSSLKLNVDDIQYTPALEYREPCHIGLNCLDRRYYSEEQVQRFAVRMRSNGFLTPITPEWGGKDKCLPGGWPEFRRIVDPKVYFEKHPEWYAEVDGKRVPGQLCLSNKEMLKTLTANFIRMIEATPGVNHATITQNDTGKKDFCHCSECMKILAEEGNQSGALLRAVNAVAEEVEKKYPGLYVNTLAYSYNLGYPNKTKPRKNVSIQICCPGEATPFDSGESAKALDESVGAADRNFYITLKKWNDISPKLYAWTYQISFGNVLLPIPNTFNLGPNIRTLVNNGVKGIFAQGNAYAPIGDFVELKAWLSAKLLWNPEVDDKALINEFLNAYYGKAAPKIYEYMQLLAKDYAQERFQHHNAYGTPPKLKPWLSLDALNKATRIFAEADKLVAGDPVSLEHVKRVKMCIEFTWLCGYHDYKAEAEKRKCEFLGPKTVRPALDQFIKDCQERKVWRLCEGNGSLNILFKAIQWK